MSQFGRHPLPFREDDSGSDDLPPPTKRQASVEVAVPAVAPTGTEPEPAAPLALKPLFSASERSGHRTAARPLPFETWLAAAAVDPWHEYWRIREQEEQKVIETQRARLRAVFYRILLGEPDSK